MQKWTYRYMYQRETRHSDYRTERLEHSSPRDESDVNHPKHVHDMPIENTVNKAWWRACVAVASRTPRARKEVSKIFSRRNVHSKKRQREIEDRYNHAKENRSQQRKPWIAIAVLQDQHEYSQCNFEDNDNAKEMNIVNKAPEAVNIERELNVVRHGQRGDGDEDTYSTNTPDQNVAWEEIDNTTELESAQGVEYGANQN